MMQDIISAIRTRHILLIDYYDPRGSRQVEPHACGISTAGHEVVRVFQVSGPSKSEEGEGFWKMMRLDRIHSLKALVQTFPRPRPGYQPGDKGMAQIYEQL